MSSSLKHKPQKKSLSNKAPITNSGLMKGSGTKVSKVMNTQGDFFQRKGAKPRRRFYRRERRSGEL